MFPNDFKYEGNRALVFAANEPMRTDAHRCPAVLQCYRVNLPPHQVKPSARRMAARTANRQPPTALRK